ncbi:hypothetical protein ACLOJK_023846 [Asimina triloba]
MTGVREERRSTDRRRRDLGIDGEEKKEETGGGGQFGDGRLEAGDLVLGGVTGGGKGTGKRRCG